MLEVWSAIVTQAIMADGKVAELTHPSAANQTRAFPPPVEAPPA
jgi:hypothetical protein